MTEQARSQVETRSVPLSWVRFNEAVYPRKEGHNPATVERYAQDLEQIEAADALITVAEDGDLLDGRHRHLGYLTRYADEPDRIIPVHVAPTGDIAEKWRWAARLNSRHGDKLTNADRQHTAIAMYGVGLPSPTIATDLSVSEALVSKWLSRTIKETKERQNDQIRRLWLACHTNNEIGKRVGLDESRIRQVIGESSGFELSPITDPHAIDFDPPIYNVWKQQEKSNEVGHFGNSEARWVDNLLYLYTAPLDIVVDPFAGGGSTIDVCKKRWRRYWCGDRKPKVSRHADNEIGGIREHDLVETDGGIQLPDLRGRWGDVRLVYLDPPYWKQAENKYSEDPTDLANMSLEQFTTTLVRLIRGFAGKLSPGSVIAMLMQPTQWKAPERSYTDHVIDILRQVKLPLDLRVQCPYESQQATAQMVEWAKESRKVLVLSRELVIWRVTSNESSRTNGEARPEV